MLTSWLQYPPSRRIAAIVVVYDVSCPRCSAIARELPDLLRVPVSVRSCRDPRLAVRHPSVPAPVAACATPAVGAIRPDGTVRWWTGLRGALGVLPVVRPGGIPAAAVLLWTAFRAARAR